MMGRKTGNFIVDVPRFKDIMDVAMYIRAV